jgi:hypothetical protein
VPAGGTAGQFLTKIDGTNYNTDWTTLNVSGKRDLTDYDFTNVANEKLTTFGLTLEPPIPSTAIYSSEITAQAVAIDVDQSEGGTVDGQQNSVQIGSSVFIVSSRTWTDGTADEGGKAILNKSGLSFGNYAGSTSGFTQYGNTSITFPNASVQTIAFPGFNNAALTGNPTAPTPATSDNDTSIATTAFVKAQGYAPLASPALTGNPTAPTATFGDNDTSIATTAFVQAGLLGGTANARNLEVYVRNQSGSTIPAGSIVYISGATGNRPLITLSQANNDANSAQTMGFTKTTIANNAFGYVIVRGEVENLNTSALTEGDQLYLSPTVAGAYTTTKPVAPQHMVYVGIVIRAHPTLGAILVAVQNGYELGEIHDVALGTLANNDLLVYESSTDLWKNKSAATLGLAGLNSPTFSGTPSLPTGTIGVTQSAGDNTTALATTAFVTAAVPAFATDAQAIAGSSTTTIIHPADYRVAGLTTNIWAPGVSGLTAVQLGTGANTGSGVSALVANLVAPNVSTAGYASRGFNIHYGSNSVGAAYNFSTASGHSVRFYTNLFASTITGVKVRGVFGRQSGGIPAPAPLSARAYGWEWDWSTRTMNIIGYNGTTLTTTPVTWNPIGFRTYEITATSDGAGTISLYVDGVLLGTSSGGPTGTSNLGFVWWQVEIQNEATATVGNTIIAIANPKVFTTNG